MTLRRLLLADAEDAADLHRRSGAHIPGYDPSRHTVAEGHAFYRDTVLVQDEVWGTFDEGRLAAFVALKDEWIDHPYVEPALFGRGLGSALVRLAQEARDALWLHTFQSNTRARRFYERHGFAIQELTDGHRNEERMPDMTYHWMRR